MPWGGARGQNLGHLRKFFFCFFFFMESLYEQHVLLSVDSLCDICP